MKMKQVADRLGKHDNTIRNYAVQYAEFLSPAPAKGETRIFTDDDLRVLSFICQLADAGMKHDAIHDTLKRKVAEGTSFPPVLPPAPSDEQRLVVLPETDVESASLVIREMEGRLEELKQQLITLNEQRDRDREAYLQHIARLSDAHTQEIRQVSQELGRLQALSSIADQERTSNLNRIDELVKQMAALNSENGRLRAELEQLRQGRPGSNTKDQLTDKPLE